MWYILLQKHLLFRNPISLFTFYSSQVVLCYLNSSLHIAESLFYIVRHTYVHVWLLWQLVTMWFDMWFNHLHHYIICIESNWMPFSCDFYTSYISDLIVWFLLLYKKECSIHRVKVGAKSFCLILLCCPNLLIYQLVLKAIHCFNQLRNLLWKPTSVVTCSSNCSYSSAVYLLFCRLLLPLRTLPVIWVSQRSWFLVIS